MFGISAVLTAVGAVSPGAVAIIAPIALGFALKYSINPLLMGLMVIHGAQAGGFSPISIYGGITNRIVAKAGLPLDRDRDLPGELRRQPWRSRSCSSSPSEGAGSCARRSVDRRQPARVSQNVRCRETSSRSRREPAIRPADLRRRRGGGRSARRSLLENRTESIRSIMASRRRRCLKDRTATRSLTLAGLVAPCGPLARLQSRHRLRGDHASALPSH